MTKEELFKKSFTRSQLDWLADHPSNKKATSDMESLANAAAALFAAEQYGGVKDKQNLAKLMDKGSLSYDLESLASTASKKFKDFEEDGKKVSGAEQFLTAFFGDENGNGKETDKAERDKWRVRIKEEYGDEGWENAKKVLQNSLLDRMQGEIDKSRKEAVESVPGESLVKFFRPRMYEAALQGRDPTTEEQIGDFGQAALYAIPYGKAVQGIRALPAAGKVLGGLAVQGAAPLGVSVMDDQLGNKDFDWRDVGIGTLTNIGVNKVLAPQLARGYQYITGKIRGKMPGLADFLEGSKTSKEKAWEIIDDAKDKLRKHYAEQSSQHLDNLAHGRPTARLTPEEVQKYTDIVSVEDLLRFEGKNIKDVFTDAVKRAGKSEIGGKKQPQAQMIGKDKAWIAQENAPNPSSTKDLLNNVIYSNDKITKKGAVDAIEANPVLASLFYKTPAREAVNSVAAASMKDFAVNKYGKDADASNPANLVQIDVKELRKQQKKDQAKARERKAADVLSLEGFTGDDYKYLDLIKRKPEVLRGIGKEAHDTNFKNWLLLRGTDILRGTELFRPTPTVE